MSAKKSKTFFKTLTAILVLLLFFGGGTTFIPLASSEPL